MANSLFLFLCLTSGWIAGIWFSRGMGVVGHTACGALGAIAGAGAFIIAAALGVV